jgi:hypothetical protein
MPQPVGADLLGGYGRPGTAAEVARFVIDGGRNRVL